MNRTTPLFLMRVLEIQLVPLLSASLVCLAGCGGASATTGGGGGSQPQAAPPTVTTASALNGAQVVTLTDATPGASVYYTLDGATPSPASTQYLAPFLVAANVTVQAVAILSAYTNSPVTTKVFAPNVATNTLVWSDEFTSSPMGPGQPNPSTWGYDTGNNGWGNHELEDYCGWGSTVSPCNTSMPNAYVGTDGSLHIAARQPSPGVYTSARMKTQGLFSFQYGRVEFRAQVPEAQGFWPAGWLLGNSIATINWPGCGELDVLERVNAATRPDTTVGSIHGPGFTGASIGSTYSFPSNQTASSWHTYGMIWKPGSIAYYVDDPMNPYVTFTPATLTGYPGAKWPFDDGPQFLLLNLAIGGDYPGSPTATTPFPSEMLVDYVRIYTN